MKPLTSSPLWPQVRFWVLLVLLFLLQQRVYLATRSHTQHFINQRMNAVPSAWLINHLEPGSDVVAREGRLVGPDTEVDISKGCEGVEVMFMVVAAMLVYPMRWSFRLAGVVVGCLYVYLANLVRIVSLYLIRAHCPQWFDLAHLTLWQTLLIIVTILFFAGWIRLEERGASTAAPKKA